MNSASDGPFSELPHGPEFCFLTSIEKVSADGSGVARWRVSGDEPFLRGHFPGRPIVPGVLIGEALAQLSGVVAARQLSGGGGFAGGRLAHLELRFSESVVPPAEIELHSEVQRAMRALWRFDVRATHEGRACARGELVLAFVEAES